DAFLVGVADDVVNREKIRCVITLRYEFKFMFHLLLYFIWNASRITLACFFPGQMFKPTLRSPSGWNRLVGILIFEVAERKRDALKQILCGGNGGRAVAEQLHHVGKRLQMALGVGFEPPTGRLNKQAFANARQNVLDRPLLRYV